MNVEDTRIERLQRLYVAAGVAYRDACVADGLGHVPALERAVQAVLKALGDKPYHVIEYGEEAFTLQHPLTCRPDLLACPFSRARVAGPEVELGRYGVTLVDGDLVPLQREED